MTTLFVSDLHLCASRPQATDVFLEFLRTEAIDAEALYILGDLFEAWVGDDVTDATADAVRAGLHALTKAGVPVFVMRGNRDFLLGPRFANDTGAKLLADPALILLRGEPTLLMHGDLLCSDDIAYQAFRKQVRTAHWQETFLAQSLDARIAFAEQARNASRQHQDGLKDEGTLEIIADVSASTVAQTLERYGVTRLIHGHTHRPAIHSLNIGGHGAQRIVLGDWYTQGSVLRVSSDGFELAAFNFRC